MYNNCGNPAGSYAEYYSGYFGNNYTSFSANSGGSCAAGASQYQGYPAGAGDCCQGGFSAGAGQYDSRAYFAIPNALCAVYRNAGAPVAAKPEANAEPARETEPVYMTVPEHEGAADMDTANNVLEGPLDAYADLLVDQMPRLRRSRLATAVKVEVNDGSGANMPEDYVYTPRMLRWR